MSQYNIRNLKCDLEKNALNYLLEEKANYLLLILMIVECSWVLEEKKVCIQFLQRGGIV